MDANAHLDARLNRPVTKHLFTLLLSANQSPDFVRTISIYNLSVCIHFSSDLVVLLRPEQNFEVKADDLEQICELGRGAYGVVDKMNHVPSGLIMAVKVSEEKTTSRLLHFQKLFYSATRSHSRPY